MINATFQVDFVHRLRFTRNALDPENPTWREVLAPTGAGPARVLAFVDAGLAAAWPGIDQQIAGYAAAHPQSLELAGPTVSVPGGEAVKNDRRHVDEILDQIHRAGLCRQSYVAVFGGGAVLDAVGYAAAIAHRGVRLVRFPTTTLAQDDSGLGVKNGINAFGKKNYLGVFSPPWAVVNDIDFLATLSERDFRSGLVEAVKVALVKDAAFFHRIAKSTEALARRDMDVVSDVIRESAVLHLRHITEGGDPFELTTARPLDFGHWAAHRLEEMTDFELRHGEAVAIGIALDTAYARHIGMISEEDAESILVCLEDLGFELHHPALEDGRSVLAGVDEFREHLGGLLTIMMPAGIGVGRDVHEIDAEAMMSAMATLARRRAGQERLAS